MKSDNISLENAPLKGRDAGRNTTLSTPEENGPSASIERERLHKLASELRCLVCQNQTIADSNSGLAIDLRAQIQGQIRSGKSDAAIKQFMVERYGDFVLYNPPFSAGNAALWVGPFILLAVGLWIAIRLLGRRNRLDTPPGKQGFDTTTSSEQLQEIEARYKQDSK